jgi:hypothetical protein
MLVCDNSAVIALVGTMRLARCLEQASRIS